MKFNDLVLKYLDSKDYTLKSRSKLFYLQILKIYISNDIGESEVSKLQEKDVNEFVKRLYYDKNYSYSTASIVKSLINRSLEYGFKKSIITKNIKCDTHLKRKNPVKVEALSHIEQEKIENYILSRDKYYSYGVLLSLYTGLRIGELLALKWTSVDFKNKTISVVSTTCKISRGGKLIEIESTPKTSSSIRVIPMSKHIESLLKKIQRNQKSGVYVVSRDGEKKIDMRSYQDSFSRMLKRLGIRHYGFHSLRHTFATRCLEVGVDIKTISELMGHANATITLNRYVHTDEETKKRAVELITKKKRV